MTVAISCCLWRFPISDRDPDCMEKLGYTDTETLLWDYSETELYHVLVIPPARARRTLYRITAEYAFQWFGLNGQNNLTVVYYPFSRVNFRNLTDPCICPPEADAFTATVSVSPLLVLEDSGIPLVFTIRLDRISASDATIDFTLTGTAIEGVDYSTVVSHSVTIAAGALTALVTIDPLIDLLFESTETVTMTLTSGVSGPGLIDVTGAMATGLIIETMAPPLPTWQRPLSVVPDAPIWHHVRADSSSTFNNGVWLASAAGAAFCDAFFSNVVLLLPFEGANLSTGTPGMTDQSPRMRGTGIAQGNAKITTSAFKFGTSSYLGDGTTDSLLFPSSVDWQLSTSNSTPFTIDAWVRSATTTPTDKVIVGRSTGAFGLAFLLYVNTTGNGELTFLGSTNSTSFDWAAPVSSGLSWVIGTWYHVAVDKDVTGKVRLFRDGVLLGSATPVDSFMYPTSDGLTVGSDNVGFNRSWNGNIDGLRITKGVSRYASDGGFIPPSGASKYLSCATACDPYWDDVVLLLGFNDVDGAVGPFSPGFIDESPHQHGTMFTTFGGQIATAQSVFGGSSARYLGGGHRSTYGDSNDWNLSVRRFTIEYRFRPVSTAFGFHVCQWPTFGGDIGWVLYHDTGFYMNVSTTGSDNINVFSSATGIFAVNTWYACCVDFDGTKYRAYVDGTMVASSTTLRTVFNSGTLFSIGAGATGSFSSNNYIDELRITMDRARYASDSGYTVATTQFPRARCGTCVSTGGTPIGVMDGLTPTGAWSASRKLFTAYAGSLHSTASGFTFFDQSGNSRNLTKGSTGTAPTVTCTGIVAGVLFDTSADWLDSTSAIFDNFVTTSTGYMIISIRPTAFATANTPGYNNSVVLGSSGQNGGITTSNNGGDNPIALIHNWDGSGDEIPVSISINSIYVMEWRHEGGILYQRKNGRDETSTASGNTLMGGTLNMGGRSLGPASFTGHIFEAAVFSTVPNLATRDALVQSFGTYVGAPV